MSSAEDIMNLIRTARRERREDLREIMEDHVGSTATSILLLNQARMSARLIDADPNAAVDAPGESSGSAPASPPQESS